MAGLEGGKKLHSNDTHMMYSKKGNIITAPSKSDFGKIIFLIGDRINGGHGQVHTSTLTALLWLTLAS